MTKMIRYNILLMLLGLVCVSCQNEARWYPSADVLLRNHSEYLDAAGKHLAVTVIIHNTSQTSITSSTITVKAVTDKREYLQSAGLTTKIIPDGKAALTFSIAYFEPDEQLQSDGISLYDSFFD